MPTQWETRMKKKLLAILLSATTLTSLSACGTATNDASGNAAESASATTESASATTESASATEIDYTSGSPWIESNLLSNVESVYDVDIKDQFDLAVNGEWVKQHEIKSGEYSNTYFDEFTDTLNERLLDIMQADSDSDSEDHNAKLVHTLYQNFMDWDARDAAGTDPLMPYLQKIEAIENYEDLADFMKSADYSFSDLFMLNVLSNPKDATSKVLMVAPAELFLDDTAYYEDLDNMLDFVKLSYDCREEAVETVLTQCGYTEKEAEQIFEGAIQFEQKMAALSYSNAELNLTETQDTLYEQVYSPEELEKYNWYSLFEEGCKACGAEEIPAVWLYGKMDYFEHLDELLSEENVEIIKDYFLAHTAKEAISLLDKDTYYKALDLKNMMNGMDGYKEETSYAIDTVTSSLGWPVSKLYCDRYVTAQDKENIHTLIDEIIDGYKEMLQEEDFLSEATKEKAIEKLDKLTINCMYPDDWSDYSYDDLELSDNYFDSFTEIQEYELKKILSELNEPVNKDQWDIQPIVQNSAYTPLTNTINILPGLVGDNLYNSDMSKEEVYGKVGVIIGHEISHAFDSSGSTYDADGNHVDWWTSEDKENFKEKTDQMVAYYDNITVWDGLNCSGELNKTEACADMGAVAVLLRMASEDPDFDYQAFFKAYARLWAENRTPEIVNTICMYDPHPLGYLRVNVTVAQFQEFYDAFDVKEGDGMYIAPEDRVKIW